MFSSALAAGTSSALPQRDNLNTLAGISKTGIIYKLTSYTCAAYERAHFAFVSVSYTWEVFSKPLLGLPKNDNCRYVCFIPSGKETLRTILEVSVKV